MKIKKTLPYKILYKLLKNIINAVKDCTKDLLVSHDLKAFGQHIRYYLSDKPAINKMKYDPPAIKENRIFFETGDSFSDNGRALFEYMIEKGYNEKYEIIWLVREPEKYKQYQYKNVKFVGSHYNNIDKRRKECFEYAYSSRYIIFTTAVNWIKVIRKNQVLINLWHGCGYKANKGGRKVLFDYCLVPGEIFIKTKATFFGVPEKKLLPLGYPRYDLMLKGSEKAKNYAEQLKSNASADKMILWMPTYRNSESVRLNETTLDENAFNIPLLVEPEDLKKLDEYCREKKILIVIKRHYLQIPYDFGEDVLTNIVYIQNDDLFEHDVQLYEFIHYADAMVSDYSSVSVDYILLDKPIGYTLDDYDAYTSSRGWAFKNPLEYMPGHHMYSLDDMKLFIDDIYNGKDKYKEKRNNVKSVMHKYTDNFSQRVLDTFEI